MLLLSVCVNCGSEAMLHRQMGTFLAQAGNFSAKGQLLVLATPSLASLFDTKWCLKSIVNFSKSDILLVSPTSAFLEWFYLDLYQFYIRFCIYFWLIVVKTNLWFLKDLPRNFMTFKVQGSRIQPTNDRKIESKSQHDPKPSFYRYQVVFLFILVSDEGTKPGLKPAWKHIRFFIVSGAN